MSTAAKPPQPAGKVYIRYHELEPLGVPFSAVNTLRTSRPTGDSPESEFNSLTG